MKGLFGNVLGQKEQQPAVMGQMPQMPMMSAMPQQMDVFGQQQGGLKQALMMGLMRGQYGRT